MKCEDFPCCGHAGDPDGCPDTQSTNQCKQCGTSFHPDNRCFDFCSRCNAEYEIKNGYIDEDTGEYVPGEEDWYVYDEG